ncbi:heparinase II/III family protein [Portibacter marinus]|uniref:heparinase II/III family protein n=1 Tax=Portibacter marinus TaxID=2898660 RepID=UPI001F2415A0|nr:heparinase II/III-family protein [Portibacter marinus]
MDSNLTAGVISISRYFHTIIHLKPIQIFYQLWYRMKPAYKVPEIHGTSISFKSEIYFQNLIPHSSSNHKLSFSFLNLTHSFSERVDWNFSKFGKLWTYHLNYFDFLLQKDSNLEHSISLLTDFYQNYCNLKDGLEPYPTSLRIINLIKFVGVYHLNIPLLDKLIALDTKRLEKNLEYHLLANHLLENAFALIFTSYYLKDERLYQKSKKLLLKELEEQILNDGAHYERSPMYHLIIFRRLLDLILLLNLNPWKGKEIQNTLEDFAGKMQSWLTQMTFSNGCLPHFNDSARNSSLTPLVLNKYFSSLKIRKQNIALYSSGFRKLSSPEMECVVNVGNITPAYQPGHAHADSLSFVMNIRNKPFIVDTGISTYEKNKRRHSERSTAAHNTVTIKGENSSDVWSGFRVGKRANTRIIIASDDHIQAEHDGFKKFNIIHRRSWIKEIGSMRIIDLLRDSKIRGCATLHFHPDISIEKVEKKRILFDGACIELSTDQFKIEDYQFASAFNQLITAKCIKVTFSNKLETLVNWN